MSTFVCQENPVPFFNIYALNSLVGQICRSLLAGINIDLGQHKSFFEVISHLLDITVIVYDVMVYLRIVKNNVYCQSGNAPHTSDKRGQSQSTHELYSYMQRSAFAASAAIFAYLWGGKALIMFPKVLVNLSVWPFPIG